MVPPPEFPDEWIPACAGMTTWDRGMRTCEWLVFDELQSSGSPVARAAARRDWAWVISARIGATAGCAWMRRQ